MTITVRAANIKDAAVLAQIGASTFYDTFRPYNSEEDMQAYIIKSYNETLITQNLHNSTIHYAIAEQDNEVVGYIKLLLNAPHPKLTGSTAELEKIYVKQSQLGSGAGKQLMEYAIDFSRNHQFSTLFLGVWKENERAVHFYRKIGFTEFDTRFFPLGTRICEDYIMKLEL
ncbi:MAG: GNAT family N-acetyltransferase [Bacteroidota bacterium]